MSHVKLLCSQKTVVTDVGATGSCFLDSVTANTRTKPRFVATI
jgi:hypothetical protein